MEILERAKPPTRATHSQTLLHAGLVGLLALLLGLFAVWLVEFLTRSRRTEAAPPTQVSVSVNGPAASATLAHAYAGAPVLEADRQAPERLPADATPRLEATGERLLRVDELEALWLGAADESRIAIGMLLNGAGAGEVLQLHGPDLDLQRSELGIGDRIVPLSPGLHAMLAGLAPFAEQHLLVGDGITSATDLDALIACAAADGGIEAPTMVTAEMVQCSYLVFLVQQGVRLAELKRVAGPLPPAVLASFAHYSPAGAGIALEDAEPFLPFLVTAAP